jgi:hypothetical protein
MTAIVGILCRDGVVIGSDSSATFGQGPNFRTIEQPTEKIDVIGGHIIMTFTGEIGLSQRFKKIVQDAWGGNQFRGSEFQVIKLLAKNAIEDFASTYVQLGSFGALVGFPLNHRPYLCEFAQNNFQPELKTDRLWYASMGSAQTITDSFLALMREIFWQGGPPSLQEGMFAVTWTLEHAIKINPGGVNEPLHISILERTRKGHLEARSLEDSELDEQRQAIADAKTQLYEWSKILQHPDQPDIPEVPKK